MLTRSANKVTKYSPGAPSSVTLSLLCDWIVDWTVAQDGSWRKPC